MKKYIRCHPWNKQARITKRDGSTITKQLGKAPLDNDWRNLPGQALDEILEAGYNAAYRIEPNVVVVDIDIQHFKTSVSNYLDVIAEFFGYFDHSEMITSTRTVQSGGGGYHHYYALPDGTDYQNIVTSTEALDGVDIKRHGVCVHAEGSRHPSGNYYELINDVPFGSFATLPAIEKLWREVVENNDAEYGQLTPEQLDELVLDKLAVSDYGNHDDWFSLMSACHHATAGEGVQQFLDWSTGDPLYADDYDQIRNRWESLHVERRGQMATIGTLFNELKRYGQDTATLRHICNNGKIEQQLEQVSAEDVFTMLAAVSGEKAAEDPELPDGLGSELMEAGAALNACRDLPAACTEEELNICLRLVQNADNLEKIQAINILVKKLGITKSEVKGLLKAINEQGMTDLTLFIRDETLKHVFNEGRHLSHEPNGIDYAYNGKYWQPVTPLFLNKLVQISIDSMRAKGVMLDGGELALVKQSTELTRIKVAKSKPYIHTSDAPNPIINCMNMELHVDKRGNVTTKPHSYDSYLSSVLDIEFDPSAECPIFIDTLQGIFSKTDSPQDMIDYLAEIFGYAIQPHKNIASWFLLKGPGSDGKSTVLKILSKLMGKAMLSTDTNILKIGGDNTNNHASTALVGKLGVMIEELPKRFLLPDGGLKMLSENRLHSANPKGKDEFSFMYAAALFMCANTWPQTADISHGMQRRAHVIPFDRNFTGADVDIDRLDKILNNTNEMSGVLNWALAGLKRLRQRGEFNQPHAVQRAKTLWLENSNHMFLFAKDCLNKDERGLVVAPSRMGKRSDVYSLYRSWAMSNSIDGKYIKGAKAFAEDIASLGYTIMGGEDNQDWIYGGTLRREDVTGSGSYH